MGFTIAKFKWFKHSGGELWGGLAAMLVALPSALAYGVAAYSPLGGPYLAQGALAGFLGAIVLGLVAPLSGGAPRLITAPSAPAAAVLAALAGTFLAGSQTGVGPLAPDKVVILLLLIGLLAGGLQVLYGIVGGGRLIKYIPYPVVSGYLSGVALLILLSQLPKFLGLSGHQTLWEGVQNPAAWQWPALVIGGVTMAAMLLAPRFTKAVPSPVFGLLAGFLTFFGLGLIRPELLRLADNPLVIGPFNAAADLSPFSRLADTCNAFHGLNRADLQLVLIPALTLSVLLSVDTLKTCVVLDALTRTRHQSNQTLIGQGAGNLVAALTGAMPGSGTMGATLVNINSGGQTRVSSLLAGGFALLAFLLLDKVIGWMPLAALAGILIVVACRMFDFGSLQLIRHRSTVLDFLVVAAVVIVALKSNLIAAAGAGLGLAILLFIREQMRSAVIRRKVYGSQISSPRQRLAEDKEVLLMSGHRTVVCELQGSLFFGTTDRLLTELEADLKHSQYVILDLRRVQSVDFSGAHLLDQIESMLTERGAFLLFSSLPAILPTGKDLVAYFGHLGLVKPGRNVRMFDTLEEALEWAEDRILEEAGRPVQDLAAPLALSQIELLREFEAEHLLEVMKDCIQEQTFAAGQVISRCGEIGDQLFMIRRGLVRISLPLEHGRHLNLATFARGDFFGDLAFLDRQVRSANATAVTDTELFVLSREKFDKLAKVHPELGSRVFARLAQAIALRLRHNDSELRALHES